MKRFSIALLFASSLLYSQNSTKANEKIEEGIRLHDAGRYSDAIDKYNEALHIDKDNYVALAEKAMTLDILGKYDDAIEICQHILKLYSRSDNSGIYVTYGNALDHAGKPGLALQIYDEGIRKNPDSYHLYFNKGITLANQEDIQGARKEFQKATLLYPNHSSSYYALAIVEEKNRIPSILAACRYLTLDNKTRRATETLFLILDQLKKERSQEADTIADKNVIEQLEKERKSSFTAIDLVLSSRIVSQNLTKFTASESERLKEMLEVVFSSLAQELSKEKKNSNDYYWVFLAPYFVKMYQQKYVEVFANIALATKNNREALHYIQKNSEKVDAFYKWSEDYWK